MNIWNEFNLSNLDIEMISKDDKNNKKGIILKKIINYFLLFFTLFNFLNFIIVLIVLGISDAFNWSRLFISILELFLIILNIKISNKNKISKISRVLLIICGILFFLFCIFFIIISILIFTGYNLEINKNNKIDYLIVLGTKINKDEPGLILKKRLQKTIEYYNGNKNITLILSGGKTSKANISEASVMKEYLLKNCEINEMQIITEDFSSNTVENFKNILKIIDKNNSFGLCTSNSHIYRAYGLAKKLDFKYLYPLSAKGSFWTFYEDILREFYCIIIECLKGNMKLYKLS